MTNFEKWKNELTVSDMYEYTQSGFGCGTCRARKYCEQIQPTTKLCTCNELFEKWAEQEAEKTIKAEEKVNCEPNNCKFDLSDLLREYLVQLIKIVVASE